MFLNVGFLMIFFFFGSDWQILSMLLERSVNPDALNRHKQVNLITFWL